ncbi:hypothetical protein N7456_005166 [Penicillium angulare]|uniref:Xylanolytic transcriptional activator regulatory domain-containing protein n=1 Tax=Penicillium angulare TaxID=116970 RepID=A0A9W9FXT7_9EURO|nr:hypothetical protein N7456_005166 [Penicillium angulare]
MRNTEQAYSLSELPIPEDSFSWLYDSELPRGDKLWILVEEYFIHVHPLRCNGFVHKPTFMQRLDEDVESCCQSESLLHIICALGAKFFALGHVGQLSSEAIITAGNQWARVAKARIFVDMDDLSLDKLMTAILLYDHDLRIGSYASAFMLSGITARISQALQLALEFSADVLCTKPDSSAISNEVRRRLMWSCYLLDSWVGSGVNQLTLLEDRDLKIQLPCHSHNFSLGVACVTEILDESEVLSFLPTEQIPQGSCQNMGIEAYFIRLVSIRKRVLRYVKHLDTGKPPWEADSEFSLLSSGLETWHRNLPQSLSWNPAAIYARKESSQLGALTLLWCTFYQTFVDLYRIGMPALFRIQKSFDFPPEQQEFLEKCRRICFENACEVSSILSESLRHGHKVLADPWLCIIAHDSTKVMLYYLNFSKAPSEPLESNVRSQIVQFAQGNLVALLQMRPIVTTAKHCSLSVVKMMTAAGIQPNVPFNILDDEQSEETVNRSPSPHSPTQDSPEDVLNPLAIYRMARTALHDRDTHSPPSTSPKTHKTISSPRQVNMQSHPPSKPTRGLQISSPSYNQQSQSSLHGEGQVLALDSSCVLPQPNTEPSVFASNQATSMSELGNGDIWDPTDFAVLDILDGGIAPWTAEYLTDGQSGIDPFLFPF